MGSDALLTAVARAVEVVGRLRGEGGCAWDRAQTRASLRPYVLEEAYEVVEALDLGDPAKIREELGDLLFQVVLHARIATERGEFDLGDVAAELAEKLVRRHPHVFGGERADGGLPEEGAGAGGDPDTVGDVELRWEDRKRDERDRRGEKRSVLAGVPLALPALARAQKVQERAARVGFDWEERSQVLAKLDEERAELSRAIGTGDPGELEHELGDLLFTVVNVARLYRLNAEDALRAAVRRFVGRFHYVERAATGDGREVKDLTLAEMDRLWEEAKKAGL